MGIEPPEALDGDYYGTLAVIDDSGERPHSIWFFGGHLVGPGDAKRLHAWLGLYIAWREGK